MATNALDAAVGALPDELLLDIFARLPDLFDLLRCASTCTRWFRLLAADDAAFFRRAGVLSGKTNAPLLLGAFYQLNDYLTHGSVATVNSKISGRPPRFWRLDNLTRPGLGLFSKHDVLFNHARPLASRRGLLLTRLMPPAHLDHRKLYLAVCHPLLGGVHHVPPPPVRLHAPFLGTDVTGYALLTGYGGEHLHDHRQRRLAFRVLFTAVHHDGVVYAYSYSSATASWSTPTKCPPQLRDLTMSGPRAGAVDGRGTTHWLYRDVAYFYTLNISPDAARVALTRIPIPVECQYVRRLLKPQPPFPCITRGGKLSFLVIRPLGYYTLLTTKRDHDENNQQWIHDRLPMFRRPFQPFKFIGFAESRGGAVLVKSYSGLFYLDLESKELELVRGSDCDTYPARELCSIPTCQGYNSCTHCAYNNCVLYKMDWASYRLHLSAWSPRSGATR